MTVTATITYVWVYTCSVSRVKSVYVYEYRTYGM